MLKSATIYLFVFILLIQMTCLPVWAEETAASGQDANPPLVNLPANSPISLVMLEELYSQRNKEGDEIVFALAEDVVVLGRTYLVAGTPVLGRVVGSKAAKSWGRKGSLDIKIFALVPLYSNPIPLSGEASGTGGSNTVAAIGTTVLLGISVVGLLAGGAWGGKGAVIPAGTKITVFTAQDGQVLDISADEMKSKVDEWYNKKIISSFLSYSSVGKVSVADAFSKAGYTIDESKITFEKGESYSYTVNVQISDSETAIFTFQPFQEPHGAKFSTLRAENDIAAMVVKQVK